MQPFENPEHDKQELERLAGALGELNNTSSQILIFLSFAIVAGVTLLTGMVEPANKATVSSSLRWWIGAIFPTVFGIVPLKEVRVGSIAWYRFVLWMRFVLFWAAILCILVGAAQFLRAI